MSKGFELLHGAKATKGETMSAKDAFKCNNVDGYLDKEDFLSFVQRLRREDYDHLDNLFQCLYERLRNNNSLRMRKDRGDQHYYWLVFPRANGDEGIKVIAHKGIVDILMAYREGKVKTDFLLEDLISEALEADTSLD
jgi:hypothetical protein